jgi:hypothetical protein
LLLYLLLLSPRSFFRWLAVRSFTAHSACRSRSRQSRFLWLRGPGCPCSSACFPARTLSITTLAQSRCRSFRLRKRTLLAPGGYAANLPSSTSQPPRPCVSPSNVTRKHPSRTASRPQTRHRVSAPFAARFSTRLQSSARLFPAPLTQRTSSPASRPGRWPGYPLPA